VEEEEEDGEALGREHAKRRGRRGRRCGREGTGETSTSGGLASSKSACGTILWFDSSHTQLSSSQLWPHLVRLTCHVTNARTGGHVESMRGQGAALRACRQASIGENLCERPRPRRRAPGTTTHELHMQVAVALFVRPHRCKVLPGPTQTHPPLQTFVIAPTHV